MNRITGVVKLAWILVAVAGSAAAGVVVGGQTQEPEYPKVVVANKASEAVPVSAVVTRMTALRFERESEVELGATTIAALKDGAVVKLNRPGIVGGRIP